MQNTIIGEFSLESFPTKPFTTQLWSFKIHRTMSLYKLHIIRRSPDLEALKLWKGRSGSLVHIAVFLFARVSARPTGFFKILKILIATDWRFKKKFLTGKKILGFLISRLSKLLKGSSGSACEVKRKQKQIPDGRNSLKILRSAIFMLFENANRRTLRLR